MARSLALLGLLLPLLAVLSPTLAQQVVMNGPGECSAVTNEIEALKQNGVDANDFCNAYVSLPTTTVTLTETTTSLPPTATATEYSTITPPPITSSETTVIQETTTSTTTVDVESVVSTPTIPPFLQDMSPDAIASACSCIPLSQVTETATSTLTVTLATPSTTTVLPVTLPATVSTTTISVTSTVTETSTVARQVAAGQASTGETSTATAGDESPIPPPPTGSIPADIGPPLAVAVPIKSEDDVQVVHNPTFADGADQWTIQAADPGRADILPQFGVYPDPYDREEARNVAVIYTDNSGEPGEFIPASRITLSQTLTLVPGKQYELSYHQGLIYFGPAGDPPPNIMNEFKAYAQLNGVQVTPPVSPCGEALPGSCTLLPHYYAQIYYEQVKAIVSSPMAETTLTIVFESREYTMQPSLDHATTLLDLITMTAVGDSSAESSVPRETESTASPTQTAPAPVILEGAPEGLSPPVAVAAPAKGEDAQQLVHNPGFADYDSQWTIVASDPGVGTLQSDFGYMRDPKDPSEDNMAGMIYTSGRRSEESDIVAASRVSYSQTLSLVPGRQYQLSYFQGLMSMSAIEPNTIFFSEFVVFAQLNGVQVTPPVHPCGGTPPGSCLPRHTFIYDVFYEEVKAIVSSPMVETTLTIVFESEEYHIDEHIGQMMPHLLDLITVTPIG